MEESMDTGPSRVKKIIAGLERGVFANETWRISVNKVKGQVCVHRNLLLR